jgi:hypothetical protein
LPGQRSVEDWTDGGDDARAAMNVRATRLITI